jgi:hypothetical protein
MRTVEEEVMTTRAKILGLLFGVLLSFSVSCVDTEPGGLYRETLPIPGIKEDDTPEAVTTVLGVPSSRANGWWADEHRFDMEFRVWYYRGVGRVIFRRDTNTVYATEADKNQTGTPTTN